MDNSSLLYKLKENEDFIEEVLNKIKTRDSKLYQEISVMIYEKQNGYHFNEELLKEACLKMKNVDGSKGAFYTLEASDKIANSYDIKMINFNKYDWNYVLNMFHSDYSDIIGNDTKTYAKMALSFINDEDGPIGKAYLYYKFIVN